MTSQRGWGTRPTCQSPLLASTRSCSVTTAPPWACGRNARGQRDLPVLVGGPTYARIGAGGAHAVLLGSDGAAVVCGRNRRQRWPNGLPDWGRQALALHGELLPDQAGDLRPRHHRWGQRPRGWTGEPRQRVQRCSASCCGEELAASSPRAHPRRVCPQRQARRQSRKAGISQPASRRRTRSLRARHGVRRTSSTLTVAETRGGVRGTYSRSTSHGSRREWPL